jgi:tetratricopeptide (TPR) repeat protein
MLRRTSLTMIVRDEERNLAACLGPVAPLFDEVVVVDTGSGDRTREVAASFGARVFDVPWSDDFAAARNAALDRVTGAWAFRLDADDRLDPPEVERLRTLLTTLPAAPVGFTVRYTHDRPGEPVSLDEVRLFPNRPDVRWRYRVHEQITPDLLAVGGAVRRTDVGLRHIGYTDPGVVRQKLERNLRLIELDLRDRPGDPFVLLYAGWTRLGLGDAAAAVAPLDAACRAAGPGFGPLPLCHALRAGALLAVGRSADALAVCREGRARCPRDGGLACVEGEALLATGRAAEAVVAFRGVLAGGWVDGPLPASGLRPRALHGLATALPPGTDPEREALWREAVADHPEFGPAWVGLGEWLVARGRSADARRVAAAAERAIPRGLEGAVVRSRIAAAGGDFRGARRELAQALARSAGSPLLKIALAQVLLLEGRDRGAAARAVAAAGEANPGHPEVARLAAILGRWSPR